MQHNFDLAGNTKPYNPADYGLPIWRDEDHQPPVQVEESAQQQTTQHPTSHYSPKTTAGDDPVEIYVQQAIQIAQDNSHGYSQANRWGPDYDCSSLVCTVVQNAGIPVRDHGASYTGNMRQAFLSCGFKDVTSSCNLNTGAGMQRGDILLNDVRHTAIYIGNNQLVHARSSEGNSMQGDQSGNEIRTQAYYNGPWNIVMRYGGGKTTQQSSISSPTIPSASTPQQQIKMVQIYVPTLKNGMSGPYVAAMQGALKYHNVYIGPDGVDGDFGMSTQSAVRNFQSKKGLTPDGICGENTWEALLK